MSIGHVSDPSPSRRAIRFIGLLPATRYGKTLFVIRHPWMSIAGLRAITALPVLSPELDDDSEGHLIRRNLRAGTLIRLVPVVGRLVSVLPLSGDSGPVDYLAGPSRRTWRRKIRQSVAAGLSWSVVRQHDERQRLLRFAERVESERVASRRLGRQGPLDDLLQYKLWLVASNGAGEPLVLSVTAVSGSVAMLRYFRSLGQGEEYSLARFYLSDVLANVLAAESVICLVDTVSPVNLPRGLRDFQRMLGWKLALLKLPRGA